MTIGPPSSEAATSGVNPEFSSSSSTATPQSTPPTWPTSTKSENLATNTQGSAYPNYAAWSGYWPSSYSGYANPAATPSMSTSSGLSQPTNVNPYLNAYNSRAVSYHRQTVSHHPYPHLAQASNSAAQPDISSLYGAREPTKALDRQPSTPPLPDPETYKHWEEALKDFFVSMKMFQTVKGLEMDFIVLNPDWEQKSLPDALRTLVDRMKFVLERMAPGDEKINSNLDKATPEGLPTVVVEAHRLDERKLLHIRLANEKTPQSPSDTIKSISQFIARSRARNNASNRAEFLQSLAERKRKVEEAQSDATATQEESSDLPMASCARADAKTIDRDKQMKYDIAKNEDGPLSRRRTNQGPAVSSTSNIVANDAPQIVPSLGTSSQPEPAIQPRKRRKLTAGPDNYAEPSPSNMDPRIDAGLKGEDSVEDELVVTHLPGIDERVQNLEEHLAVRYVPSRPRTILACIKYLEDHLIKLEKEFPPWAALHFNQPHRGWPPPPRATPVIVPPHLRSSTIDPSSQGPTKDPSQAAEPPPAAFKGKGRAKTSTLHKAVMDRLEVRKAMEEIAMKPAPG